MTARLCSRPLRRMKLGLRVPRIATCTTIVRLANGWLNVAEWGGKVAADGPLGLYQHCWRWRVRRHLVGMRQASAPADGCHDCDRGCGACACNGTARLVGWPRAHPSGTAQRFGKVHGDHCCRVSTTDKTGSGGAYSLGTPEFPTPTFDFARTGLFDTPRSSDSGDGASRGR